jgi:hypothetical protein
MDEALDIFRSDGFTVASLDRVVKSINFVPGAIGRLGVFTPRPVRTRSIEIMQDQETLRLIPTTEIGAPAVQQARDSGLITNIRTYRLAKDDRVEGHELQDILANYQNPNDTGLLRDATTLIYQRIAKLKQEWAMTAEYHMLGALQGKIIDADGTSVVRDYFAAFNVTQSAFVSVDFANLSAQKFNQYWVDNFTRPITRALKDRIMPGGNADIVALVGDNFWAALMTHPGFYNAVIVAQQSNALLLSAQNRDASTPFANNAWQQISFGGVTWINYLGTDDGTTIAINTNQAIFFPRGVQDVFRQYMGPGESVKLANQMGEPWYVFVQPDPRDQMAEYVDIALRSYPLFAAIFPQVLLRAKILGT